MPEYTKTKYPGVYLRDDVPYIRYDTYDAIGKRHQHTQACPRCTPRQAYQRLEKIRTEIREGKHTDPATITVAEYMRQWLKRCSDLSPTTLEGYRRNVELHIIPHIGHIRLDKLRPLHIQELHDRLLDDKLPGSVSAKTLRNIHSNLHAALSKAVELPLISANPASPIKPPKVRAKEVNSATEDQIITLLTAIEESAYRIPILIALATGMRRAELMGLKWRDYTRIDDKRAILTIQRTRVQITGDIIIKGTKTDTPRMVPIGKYLAGVLDEWKVECKSEWICSDPDGEPWTPQAVGKGYARIARSLGINVTLHGLRHTQATQLLMAGVPIKAVAERLGHATSVMTDRYTHVLPHIQDEAVDVMENILTKRKTG